MTYLQVLYQVFTLFVQCAIGMFISFVVIATASYVVYKATGKVPKLL